MLNGCVIVDGGSLKSELEHNYNTMFGTDFDYLGSVEVVDILSERTVIQMSAEEFYSKYLQHAKILEESMNLHFDYVIRVLANDDPMFRKRQLEETFTFNKESKVLCSKKKCVKLLNDIEG